MRGIASQIQCILSLCDRIKPTTAPHLELSASTVLRSVYQNGMVMPGVFACALV